VTDRRAAKDAITRVIAASGESIADVEKAAGLRHGELQSYLEGSDIQLASLVAVSGLLGVSAVDLLPEASDD
jgi:hypothetical protein